MKRASEKSDISVLEAEHYKQSSEKYCIDSTKFIM